MDSEQNKSERPDVPAGAAAAAVDPSTPATAARVAAAAAEIDLSAEIASAIEREPGDRVRVTRVIGTHYRCNWWAETSDTGRAAAQTMAGLVTTTYRVRKSRFLSVTKVGGGLLIVDPSKPSAN